MAEQAPPVTALSLGSNGSSPFPGAVSAQSLSLNGANAVTTADLAIYATLVDVLQQVNTAIAALPQPFLSDARISLMGILAATSPLQYGHTVIGTGAANAGLAVLGNHSIQISAAGIYWISHSARGGGGDYASTRIVGVDHTAFTYSRADVMIDTSTIRHITANTTLHTDIYGGYTNVALGPSSRPQSGIYDTVNFEVVRLV